jgi:serine/threonine-protein kinase
VTDIDAVLAASLSRRFRIVHQLGTGGMATIYRAEQIAVGNRPVALQVFHRVLLEDPDFLRRFGEAAASIASICHPNVVTIYESGQSDDGTPYIAMEFLEGEPLGSTLQRRGPLPAAVCAEIVHQAARGLHAAHKLGIVHRDLKPSDIFLTNSNELGAHPVGACHGIPRSLVVKIADFGMAHLRDSPSRTLVGRVPYLSYEQVCGMKGDELDARSDIYSLGVLVYEMLTGRVPSDSDTFMGYLHSLDSPPPFRAVNPHLPPLLEVEKVVRKALNKDRNQRYASVLEFAGKFAQAVAAEDPGGYKCPWPTMKSFRQ